MGIDCKLTLPAAAQIRDVADVIGALLGKPMHKRPIYGVWSADHNHGVIAFRQYGDLVERNRYEPNVPECLSIDIETSDGPRSFLYHYEWDAIGNRGMMMRAFSENIALCVALCDFFGGSVDFNDCDTIRENYRQPAREDIHRENGTAWQSFQQRKLDVQPLTKADIARYTPEAAYR